MRITMVPGAKEGCGLGKMNREGAACLGDAAAEAREAARRGEEGAVNRRGACGTRVSFRVATWWQSRLLPQVITPKCSTPSPPSSPAHSPWNSAGACACTRGAAAPASGSTCLATEPATPAAFVGLPKYCTSSRKAMKACVGQAQPSMP